jgi:hypothetical protein
MKFLHKKCKQPDYYIIEKEWSPDYWREENSAIRPKTFEEAKCAALRMRDFAMMVSGIKIYQIYNKHHNKCNPKFRIIPVFDSKAEPIFVTNDM